MSFCFVDPSRLSENSPDNLNYSLIVCLHDSFDDNNGDTYIIQDLKGSGSYAEVYKALNTTNNGVYAFKISKSLPVITAQANREIQVLTQLKQFFDESVLDHVGELIGSFDYLTHKISIFTLYPMTLQQLIFSRDCEGFPLPMVQLVAQCLTPVIRALHDQNIIHTDIKPENIVIEDNSNVRLIDFGGCIFPSDPVFKYIQSRYYRAPEVLLEYPATPKIDVWSLGCVLAETFLGQPIFAGKDTLNMLQLIELRIGEFPRNMLSDLAGEPSSYFIGNQVVNNHPKHEVFDQAYYRIHKLPEMIQAISFIPEQGAPPEVIREEQRQKSLFTDLLMGMLRIDPEERLTIEQVMNHPFMSEPF